jgi:ribosomal protein L31
MNEIHPIYRRHFIFKDQTQHGNSLIWTDEKKFDMDYAIIFFDVENLCHCFGLGFARRELVITSPRNAQLRQRHGVLL